jgi:hypothetical protein
MERLDFERRCVAPRGAPIVEGQDLRYSCLRLFRYKTISWARVVELCVSFLDVKLVAGSE